MRTLFERSPRLLICVGVMAACAGYFLYLALIQDTTATRSARADDRYSHLTAILGDDVGLSSNSTLEGSVVDSLQDASEDMPEPSEAGTSFAVSVVDRKTKLPISNAHIWGLRRSSNLLALKNEDVVFRRTSGEKGTAQIPSSREVLKLIVRSAGYEDAIEEMQSEVLSVISDSGAHEIGMDPLGATVSGRVVDDSGAPIAKAQVCCLPIGASQELITRCSGSWSDEGNGSAPAAVNMRSTRTLNDGSFSISVSNNLSAVQLCCCASGYAGTSRGDAGRGTVSLSSKVVRVGRANVLFTLHELRAFFLELEEVDSNKPLDAGMPVLRLKKLAGGQTKCELVTERVLWKDVWRSSRDGFKSEQSIGRARYSGFVRRSRTSSADLPQNAKLEVSSPGYGTIATTVRLWKHNEDARWERVRVPWHGFFSRRELSIVVKHDYPKEVAIPSELSLEVRLENNFSFLLDGLRSKTRNEWSFKGVPDRELKVWVRDGVRREELKIEAGNNLKYQVRLPPPTGFFVRVKNASGQRIYGSRLMALLKNNITGKFGPARIQVPLSNTRTPPKQREWLTSCPAGEYLLAIMMPGYEQASTEFQVFPNKVTAVDIQLSRLK